MKTNKSNIISSILILISYVILILSLISIFQNINNIKLNEQFLLALAGLSRFFTFAIFVFCPIISIYTFVQFIKTKFKEHSISKIYLFILFVLSLIPTIIPYHAIYAIFYSH